MPPASALPILLIAAACAVPLGCHPLPTYPPASAQEITRHVGARFAEIQTLTASCDIDLSGGDDSITLEGAIAIERPDKFRLRAYKLGHAVFDITAVGNDVWSIPLPEEAGDRAEPIPARKLVQTVWLLGPGFFDPAVTVSETPGLLVVRAPGLGSDDLRCDIDRATRTARRFHGEDSSSPSAPNVILDDYRLIGDIPWPHTVRFSSGQRSVEVRFHTVEINQTPLPRTFQPPKRAVPQP